MSSNEVAISVQNLSKCYQIYDKPQDRLKQSIMLRLQRLIGHNPTNYFKEFWALKDISFEVRKGETVGIIGRNGSGKSTLLQIIYGTLQPTSGTVETHGRVAALLELGAGFNPEFTGRENVYMNGAVLGLTNEEIDARFENIAAFADIGEFIEQPVKTYSSGMFARLAFAVASSVEPNILIVDEILSVGDAAFQRKCMKRFYELRDRGCTILIVAHDDYLVRSSCHQAIYLKNGQMIAFGSGDEVTARYNTDLGLGKKKDEVTRREPTVNMQQTQSDKLFHITEVVLLAENDQTVNIARSGDTLRLRMRFEAVALKLPDAISFVFNLYNQDGLYICGTTTLMEGMLPHVSGTCGEVMITFPNIPLLRGRYIWRVAINDDGGLLVHAEAKEVCPFEVIDDFRSLGLIDLQREWNIVIDPPTLLN